MVAKPGESANTDQNDCGHDYERRLLFVGARRNISGKSNLWSVHGPFSSALKCSTTMVYIRRRVGKQISPEMRRSEDNRLVPTIAITLILDSS
jgi:hypothetical protein